MENGWIKRLLPRGLYGRAALILILPILTLQLVVSVVFIQRHFAGVTRQMTRNVALEVKLLQDVVDTAPDVATALAQTAPLTRDLRIVLTLPAPLGMGDERLFYDLSGRTIMATLRDEVPTVQAIDLASSTREVTILLQTEHGGMRLLVDRRRMSASNPHQLLVLMIVTGLLMTLIAFIFLRNQLRPIRRLARAAEAFGKGRHMKYRPVGATEVRAAGNAFLDMRARIERQMEQRTMMLSGVSHDLRTPLTRLKLSLSLTEPGPETEAMARDVRDMERILDTFLDFARSDAMGDVDDTDPVALLQSVAEQTRRMGGDVTLGTLPAAGQTVPLRALAVERALQNLTNNALRHGTHARLGLDLTDRVVRFVVEDDGPGIPADQRDEAMKPFSRLDAARNQDKGSGVGLGLAIASDVARSHGGLLRLGESADLGGLKAELVLAR
ncbi:ATP-binding protein [Actibacterium ureilyticum]|uniref:ATP-binding protein n=1 Tax=Actibacterium ureilyticum TaxID=1590614 RepID=UPI000BAAE872|nr:ATP-binding protein [Actibacterium ureilyticum]